MEQRRLAPGVPLQEAVARFRCCRCGHRLHHALMLDRNVSRASGVRPGIAVSVIVAPPKD